METSSIDNLYPFYDPAEQPLIDYSYLLSSILKTAWRKSNLDILFYDSPLQSESQTNKRKRKRHRRSTNLLYLCYFLMLRKCSVKVLSWRKDPQSFMHAAIIFVCVLCWKQLMQPPPEPHTAPSPSLRSVSWLTVSHPHLTSSISAHRAEKYRSVASARSAHGSADEAALHTSKLISAGYFMSYPVILKVQFDSCRPVAANRVWYASISPHIPVISVAFCWVKETF